MIETLTLVTALVIISFFLGKFATERKIEKKKSEATKQFIKDLKEDREKIDNMSDSELNDFLHKKFD